MCLDPSPDVFMKRVSDAYSDLPVLPLERQTVDDYEDEYEKYIYPFIFISFNPHLNTSIPFP